MYVVVVVVVVVFVFVVMCGLYDIVWWMVMYDVVVGCAPTFYGKLLVRRREPGACRDLMIEPL